MEPGAQTDLPQQCATGSTSPCQNPVPTWGVQTEARLLFAGWTSKNKPPGAEVAYDKNCFIHVWGKHSLVPSVVLHASPQMEGIH